MAPAGTSADVGPVDLDPAVVAAHPPVAYGWRLVADPCGPAVCGEGREDGREAVRRGVRDEPRVHDARRLGENGGGPPRRRTHGDRRPEDEGDRAAHLLRISMR